MKYLYAPGFALMEVLVSLTLVSVLFSFIVLQHQSIRQARSTLYRSLARNQIDNLAEIFQKNHKSAINPTSFLDWNHLNAQLLPEGHGEWHYLSDHICVIVLHWFYDKQLQAQQTVRC